MGKIRKYAGRFAWWLDDPKRAALSLVIGSFVIWLGWRHDWRWEIVLLSAWNVAAIVYLTLLAVILFSASASNTRNRAALVDRAELSLLVALVVVTVLSVVGIGAILTAVGQRPSLEKKLLVGLSIAAVILSWLLLHTAFALHYARIYYDKSVGAADGCGGLDFPNTPMPAFVDFVYLSFTIGLTYATSDVDITDTAQRRVVFAQSVISFFFYSLALGVVLNAVVTS